MSENEEADDDDDNDEEDEERLGFAIPYDDGCDGVGLATSVGLGGGFSVRVFCFGLVGDVEFDLSAEDGGGGGGGGGGGPVTGAGGSLVLDLDVLFDSVSLA